MYEDIMPSGKRIYELTAESMKIDRLPNDGCSMCYELYVADFEEAADRFARGLNETEKKFFETVCSIGGNYRPPAQREANEQSAYEIRRELARELYGEDLEYEPDDPSKYGYENGMEWEIEQKDTAAEREIAKRLEGLHSRLEAANRANLPRILHEQVEKSNNEGKNIMSDDIHFSEFNSVVDAKQQRIDRLEAWVAEAISKPSMPRELLLQGMDLIEAQRPDVRQSVERICPSRAQRLERSLEIER